MSRVDRLEQEVSTPAVAPQVPFLTIPDTTTEGNAAAVPPAPTPAAATAAALPAAPPVWSGNVGFPRFTPPPIAPTGTIPSLPRKLLDKILRGEFVEMEELLPENVAAARDPVELVTNNDGRNIALNVCSSKKRSIQDFPAWLEAFVIYMGAIVQVAPHRAHELLSYQYIIMMANQQFATPAVLNYDRAFRTALAGTSAPWSAINQTLWSLHLISSPRPSCPKCVTHHSRDRCPGQQQPSQQPFLAGAGHTRQVCFNYNRGRPCTQQPCTRLHTCSSCREKGHSAHNCSTTKGRYKWQSDSRAKPSSDKH